MLSIALKSVSCEPKGICMRAYQPMTTLSGMQCPSSLVVQRVLKFVSIFAISSPVYLSSVSSRSLKNA